MTTEIEQCPFCGGDPTITETGSAINHMWLVSCNNVCSMNPAAFGEQKDETIAMWNLNQREPLL